QFLRRVRLADKVIGAALDRFDRVVERVVGGQNDHLRFRPLGFDLIQDLQSFHVRQLQIEQDKRGRFVLQRFQSGRGSRGGLRLESVTTQQRLQGKQNRPLIVNDQNSARF